MSEYRSPRTKAVWQACDASDCIGECLPELNTCYRHAAPDERRRHVAEAQSRKKRIIGRGVVFDASLLDEFLDLLQSDHDEKTGQSLRDLGCEARFDEATFEAPAAFERITFHGFAGFSAASFQKGASFYSSHFREGLSMSHATVANSLILDGCYVSRSATFNGLRVDGSASFSGTTFVARAKFNNTVITASASFADAQFREGAQFHEVAFGGGGSVSFEKARWGGPASFTDSSFQSTSLRGAHFDQGLTVALCAFGGATNLSDAVVSGLSCRSSTFDGKTQVLNAQFSGDARFYRCTFRADCSFGGTQITRMQIALCAFEHSLTLHLNSPPPPRLTLNKVGTAIEGPSVRGAAKVVFGGMSLANTHVTDTHPANLRFRAATDIDGLHAPNAEWPRDGRRYTVGDEYDIGGPRGTPPAEVERICRALRKNYEDRHDRVGAHGWYISEMEIGRKNAPRRSLKRIARTLYLLTSEYGFSVLRPLAWLAIAAVVGFAVLTQLGSGSCLFIEERNLRSCVGTPDIALTILFTLFLQPPPNDIQVAGLSGVTFIFLRVLGAAMLVSIGLAFRNQVAR